MRITLPSAIAILATIALVVAVVVGAAPDRLADDVPLEGVWSGEREVEPGVWLPVQMHLPGAFHTQGLPADAHLRLHRTVHLPASDEPWALHIANVRHALAVRLDGAPIAQRGDLRPRAADRDRHEGSATVLLPPTPEAGPHRLTLEVQGGPARGGLAGRLWLAPVDQVLPLLVREHGSRLGFALTFGLIGCIHLLSASFRTARRSEMLFGAFTIALSLYAFHHAAAGFLWHTHPVAHHIVRRFLVAGMLTFAVLFGQQFVRGRLLPTGYAWAGVQAVAAAWALLGPHASYQSEVFQDVVGIGVSAPWVLRTLLEGGRERVPGARWLFAALVVAAFGAGHEALVTHGLLPEPRLLYPSLCLFMVFGSLALAQQDRDLSDRHRHLMHSSEDAILEVTIGGTVRQRNPAAEDLLGGLGATRLQEAVEPGLVPLLGAHLSRAGEAPTRCEFTLTDGRVVESVATPVGDTTRLLILRDVSRRRQADEELLTAARVETAGMLLGGITHDVNNLLASLLGHVGLLRLHLEGTEHVLRLDRMEAVIGRASSVTRRMLALGGEVQGSVGQVDIAALLDDVTDMAGPALPSTVTLERQLDEGLPRAKGSSEDLRHVLLNLVLNARDALTEQGGGTIRLVARAEGDSLVVEVADDGPGVPESLQDRIWEPFFTTKGPQRGTGLGLPMVRRLVRQGGGQVDYVQGDGATFRLRLPLALASGTPVPHYAGARVAVVDDEEAIRTGFATALRRAGYLVDAYPDAQSALRVLVTDPPDVLVSDVVMPGMSGLELALSLRELHSDLPIVIVSGFVPADAQRLTEGPIVHLDKPLRAKQLVDAVGSLLNRSLEPALRRNEV